MVLWAVTSLSPAAGFAAGLADTVIEFVLSESGNAFLKQLLSLGAASNNVGEVADNAPARGVGQHAALVST